VFQIANGLFGIDHHRSSLPPGPDPGTTIPLPLVPSESRSPHEKKKKGRGGSVSSRGNGVHKHIFPRTRTDKTEARRRTCVPPPARPPARGRHPSAGRVTDVVRTSTTAPETERERERESRRNRESIQGARPARPLCSTAHPQAKGTAKAKLSIRPVYRLDRSSFERSRHIRSDTTAGARTAGSDHGTARLLAQVCASSARHRPSPSQCWAAVANKR
jgi:hypothetical protein